MFYVNTQIEKTIYLMETKKELHTFMSDNKEAKVFLTNEGYVTEYYEDDKFLGHQVHPGKSEQWAEDAGENFVMGLPVTFLKD
jgi:imidazoleglycerol phosphate synthase glutamine amidotransferase subunit HisH|tara:strand:- start:12561 stop:12809 length:249 start_codon:yes stop_codon:yes gene_type:complete